jgi:hypothetical protein
MTSEKSNNNHKPASPAEPADKMSGDEMYAAAIELPYDDPRKAYLEDQMRKLYGSVIDRLTPEWKAVISNLNLPAATLENPSCASWDGEPALYAKVPEGWGVPVRSVQGGEQPGRPQRKRTSEATK